MCLVHLQPHPTPHACNTGSKYLVNISSMNLNLRLSTQSTHNFFHHIYFLHQGNNIAYRNEEEI